jgi:hypothetical protein
MLHVIADAASRVKLNFFILKKYPSVVNKFFSKKNLNYIGLI